ncbi:MAG: 3D domain-containing protein [Selenomonadaceae bacterium]|nr:3D domain-containing protein [Selenomonadaceae bacterium]
MGCPAWDATGCCVGGGMMKRKIFEKIRTIEKKIVLCLMLTGFTAMNTGFTEQEEEVLAESIEVEFEETSTDEPTSIAVGENGRLTVDVDDELSLAFANVVEKSLGQDLSQAGDAPFDNIKTIEDLPVIEEQPPENVVETTQGYLSYSQTLDMEATAYLPTDGSVEGITAMGIPATYGIVAVDPDVIPLGSRVYIPGYGEALAADTGGAIYGNRIDLCMESYSEAMDFGRRYVTVFVLK